MQSDKVLLDAMPPEPEADVGGWDLDMFRDPADLDYNQLVLAGTATPLTEAIRREGRRAVTLMELMDAFDEARRESEIQLQLNALAVVSCPARKMVIASSRTWRSVIPPPSPSSSCAISSIDNRSPRSPGDRRRSAMRP